MDLRPTAELVDHLIDFFDAVAPAYDSWADGLNRRVAQRLAQLADPQAGESMLDVGTGTGLVAHAASPYLGRKGAVIGIDLSEGMLEIARRQARPNMRFIGMAAERLVFRDGSFDLVTYGQSLSYLVDPVRSLAEAFRVLRPGGRVAISSHRRSLNTEAQELFFSSLGQVAHRHHLKLPRHSDERARFGERDVLPRMLTDRGFVDVRLTEMVTGGRAVTPRAWTELMVDAGPLPHALITVLGPRLRAEFEAELEQAMAGLEEDDAFRYHHAFLFAVASRPS